MQNTRKKTYPPHPCFGNPKRPKPGSRTRCRVCRRNYQYNSAPQYGPYSFIRGYQTVSNVVRLDSRRAAAATGVAA
jgi:hypothetical protein